MKITWTKTAWEDYIFWQVTDKQKLKRINELIKNTLRDPFKGIGNPEPLKHDLQGYWSRRIDGEHRLLYSFDHHTLLIIACRFHY
ncbi:Txe/YoeB family addiction module toxin [Pedobacter cryophilus]|uniref:Putative mRNA interferase YoeB n=1 Tax=Pedobacter cryophilus TaxID=2571271 RepID=A0A4U1C222_9SPHI|nr:Txe/YoeB family addiction module toxin [Pedobacter cryophilus]TKB99231.1 Txe/YoeB family addiction module toxin [Pedobacter cryophilus]